MNFTSLSKELSKEFNIPQKETAKMLGFLLKRMRFHIMFGQEIFFHNIGTMIIRKRMPKRYLNLQTNKICVTKKKYFLSLRVSKVLAKDLAEKTVF